MECGFICICLRVVRITCPPRLRQGRQTTWLVHALTLTKFFVRTPRLSGSILSRIPVCRVALAFLPAGVRKRPDTLFREESFYKRAWVTRERHFTLKSAGQRILGVARANDQLWSVVAAVLLLYLST